MNTILIGFKHCGKTSVGRMLAEQTGRPFLDTDHLIEQLFLTREKEFLSVQAIYQTRGESYFRRLEKEVIHQLTDLSDSVVATGGGSVLDPENVKQLQQLGKLIYLAASFEVIQARLATQTAAVFIKESASEQYQARKERYHEAADLMICVDDKSVALIVNEIMGKI